MNRYSPQPTLGMDGNLRSSRLLMVCYYDPNGIPTIYENIANWQQFSRYSIEVLNLWPGRNG
ncbi:hypothetical protein, partial [Microvirga antarctica]|uniref:hypothetical protein n=1 Tax=Microvirga antarctica TaxID=2819233 RepID=UPI001B3066F9